MMRKQARQKKESNHVEEETRQLRNRETNRQIETIRPTKGKESKEARRQAGKIQESKCNR